MLEALGRALPGAELLVAESAPDGVRYTATLPAGAAAERAGAEAAMRRDGLRELHAAGLLGQEA